MEDVIVKKINEHEGKIIKLEGETSRIIRDVKELKDERKHFVDILRKVEDALKTLAHTVEKLDTRLQCEEDYTRENKQDKKNLKNRFINAMFDTAVRAMTLLLFLGFITWLAKILDLASLIR